MVSIPLFVLLLATYAYSVPLGMNDEMSKQQPEVTSPQPMKMDLIEDGALVTVTPSGRVPLTTDRNAFRTATPQSPFNNERAPRGMVESWTTDPTNVEATSSAMRSPRGMVESWTTDPTNVETTSSAMRSPRGMVESWTTDPTKVETTSPSMLRPSGMIQSPTTVLPTEETSTQFNQRGIRGQNALSGMDLQTTEEPLSSSVSTFTQSTGLLRNQRGEQESTSMTMDEVTTVVASTDESNKAMNEATTVAASTGRSKTVIEVIPGRNTQTEIIPGRNIETEIISGPNTKTEIITSGSGRLVAGSRVLSQGQN